jgi:hypothetical protein
VNQQTTFSEGLQNHKCCGSQNEVVIDEIHEVFEQTLHNPTPQGAYIRDEMFHIAKQQMEVNIGQMCPTVTHMSKHTHIHLLFLGIL